MSSPPIFRFAPSPNGLLHLGHAYSALLSAGAAKALGGTWLLRIEDIDLQRSKPDFVAAILEDLRWLGLSWPEPVLRQSDRFPIYRAAIARLNDAGLLYPCFCSRTEIAAEANGTDPDGAPRYSGRCGHLSPDAIAAHLACGRRPQLRLRMADAEALVGPLRIAECAWSGHDLPVESVTYRDAVPSDWGDAVIVRKDTPTSYHLSVVVDDAAQAVTHVTRGMDLFRATDLHVLLQALLGLPSPLYAHHALIRDKDERKLAKSRGSASLRSYREAGWSPADVRQHLGFP